MDMSGMGGMDMGSATMFAAHNSALARGYWYIIAGVLAFTFLIRCFTFLQTSMRLRASRSGVLKYPTQPRNSLSQTYATLIAVCRELSGPELYFTGRHTSWLSPPSLGRSIVLLIYWAVITYMLTSGAIIDDAYYWERIGFRAAWVSATQVPFVYLLASKSSIIGFLSGTSHDRLNWFHRWVSRTLLVTVTIHGGFFFTEWWRADFIALELSIMPIIKYGIGAWFVLLWTFISSLAPIRGLAYEFFVLQHIAAAAVFLWLIYVHMPSYAKYNVWFAIAALAFDKAFVIGTSIWRNIDFRHSKKLGHHAEIRTINGEVIEVIVRDVGFSWTAGQHIYLRIPRISPLEAHPFTIANAYQKYGNKDIQLYIKAKTGFTRRLQKKAELAPKIQSYTAFISGPFGCPPIWKSFETLILISSSNGASFTLPIIDSIIHSPEASCVKRIDTLMIVRNKSHITFFLPRLRAALASAETVGIALNITIAITCPCSHPANLFGEDNCADVVDDLTVCKCGNKVRSEVLMSRHEKLGSCSSAWPMLSNKVLPSSMLRKPASNQEGPLDNSIELLERAACCSSSSSPKETSNSTVDWINRRDTSSSTSSDRARQSSSSLLETQGRNKISYSIGSRPDIPSFIRDPVEATGGETSIAVCGSRSLCVTTRNFVAALSDERAVHKGTGAQGIHLHTETHCF